MYDMQKLLALCPVELPADLVPSGEDKLFVDVKHIRQSLTDNGFEACRIFSPTGILTLADREVVASRDEVFVGLMDLSISVCDSEPVVSSSASLIFICNKTK